MVKIMPNEKKYIDASLFTDDTVRKLFYGCCYDGNEFSAYTSGAYAMLNEINGAPAADVAEVVRCKDCKHLLKDFSASPHHLCMRQYPFRHQVKLDDFCSKGERKDGETNVKH
jgi:hypothetical protein